MPQHNPLLTDQNKVRRKNSNSVNKVNDVNTSEERRSINARGLLGDGSLVANGR